jgi:hypothetical protein
MTPQDVDAGFAAVIVGEETLAGLQVFTGTSPAVLPQEALAIVGCGPLRKVAGNFYTAEVAFLIDSPALAAGLDAHNALCAALLDLLADPSGLITAWDSDAATLIGSHLDRSEQRTQDARWIFEAVLIIGITSI